MDSLEFKTLCVTFSQNLKRIDEELYAAVQGDLSEAEVSTAVYAGSLKLKEWGGLLEKLDDFKRQQATERYGERVADIEESLRVLSQATKLKGSV